MASSLTATSAEFETNRSIRRYAFDEIPASARTTVAQVAGAISVIGLADSITHGDFQAEKQKRGKVPSKLPASPCRVSYIQLREKLNAVR